MTTEKVSFQDLIQSEKPVLVDFFATWCGPCQAMTPILKEVAGELKDDVRIIKIDVDRNPAIASQYQIRGVPTFMLFKEGKMLWQQSGMISKGQLKQVIQSHQSA